MYASLSGMRVVEGASFIAAPSCGLYLSQMGAEVIRFDMIGGGPDFHRWPRSDGGSSLYWEGLNKGKKSIAIDLMRPEGRDLATQLITAPGDEAGIFVTNYPVGGFLAHERLAERRPDMITLRIMGWPGGGNAVDYTVNAAIGLPFVTGPASLGKAPVNHVLPAWDLLTGAYAAFALMAAIRERTCMKKGQEVRVPLSDVALATLGNLGQIAEVVTTGRDRPRMGNDLFGAFGRDFVTKDGQPIMLVAITRQQWNALVRALDVEGAIASLEKELSVSFSADEGARFTHRARLFSLFESTLMQRTLAEIEPALVEHGACWSRFRTLKEGVCDDALLAGNPVFAEVAQPSGHAYAAPGAAATMVGSDRKAPARAPHLGEHTDEILANVLGLTSAAIGRLHDQRIVAGAARPDA